MPVNTRWPVAEVLDAAWEYAAVTGRRVSIEYALIRDINDQSWRAHLLGSLLKGQLVHVNLIPAEPDAGIEMDCLPSRRRAGVRSTHRGPWGARHRARHAGSGDRRRVRATGCVGW